MSAGIRAVHFSVFVYVPAETVNSEDLAGVQAEVHCRDH